MTAAEVLGASELLRELQTIDGYLKRLAEEPRNYGRRYISLGQNTSMFVDERQFNAIIDFVRNDFLKQRMAMRVVLKAKGVSIDALAEEKAAMPPRPLPSQPFRKS